MPGTSTIAALALPQVWLSSEPLLLPVPELVVEVEVVSQEGDDPRSPQPRTPQHRTPQPRNPQTRTHQTRPHADFLRADTKQHALFLQRRCLHELNTM